MSSSNIKSSLKTIWSDGSIVERSPRIVNSNTNPIPSDISKSVVNECLENTDMLNVINQPIFSRTENVKELNSRELNFTKMKDRELVGSCTMNPFIDNDYSQHIIDSNNFLQSQNTTQEKQM
jgi:hypothetical protein